MRLFNENRKGQAPPDGGKLLLFLGMVVFISYLTTDLSPNEEIKNRAEQCKRGRAKILEAIKQYSLKSNSVPYIGCIGTSGYESSFEFLVQEGCIASLPICPEGGFYRIGEKSQTKREVENYLLYCSKHPDS